MRTVAIPLAALALAGPASAHSNAERRESVEITYLGNAGWQISDGKVVVLVDPYLSEFRKNAPSGQIGRAHV